MLTDTKKRSAKSDITDDLISTGTTYETIKSSEEEQTLLTRLNQLGQLEQTISQKERELKEREKRCKEVEKAKKQVLLRLSPALWEALAQWAEEDFRSINGQIEFLLADCVKKHDEK